MDSQALLPCVATCKDARHSKAKPSWSWQRQRWSHVPAMSPDTLTAFRYCCHNENLKDASMHAGMFSLHVIPIFDGLRKSLLDIQACASMQWQRVDCATLLYIHAAKTYMRKLPLPCRSNAVRAGACCHDMPPSNAQPPQPTT